MSDFYGYLPSDSGDHTPDLGVGIDTIALVGPSTAALGQELRYQKFKRQTERDTEEMFDSSPSGHERFPVGLGSVLVRAWTHGDTVSARFELSVPRMMWGHNRDALHPGTLVDAVDAILGYLGEFLPGIPGVRDVRVSRIDLARDFHAVPDPVATLAVLGGRRAPHSRLNSHQHGPDGRLQTVTTGSMSQALVRAYIKGVELAEKARLETDPGRREFLRAWAHVSTQQLRYELQLRREVVAREGLRTVADCTGDRLERVALKYYQRAGWHVPYGGDRVAEVLRAQQAELRPARYKNLLKYVLAESRGIPHGLGRHALEAVRPIARSHQLLDQTQRASRCVLDFTAGGEIEQS